MPNNKKFVCATCGSAKVAFRMWKDPNSMEQVFLDDDIHIHCIDCDNECALVYEDEFLVPQDQ